MPFHFIENINLHKDGHEVILETSGAPFYSKGGELGGFRGIDRDITMRKDLESLAQDTLTNIPGVVFKYTTYDDPEKNDSISYVSPDSAMIWGYTPDQIKNDPTCLWQQIHPDDLDEMRKSVSESASNHTLWDHRYRTIDRSGKEKWLRARGKPRKTREGVSWHTIVIDVSELVEANEKRVRALEGTVAILREAVRVRDPYTSQHEERVSQICVKIATHLGLDAEQIESLRIAGLIHDIGKLAIPIEILSKPTKLTSQEYDLIKSHVNNGCEIIKDVEFSYPVYDIVAQHHERLDGSGYPEGLKSEQLSIESRVIAVADVFEAMVNHRPYRAAISTKQTMDHIRSEAGVLYDARVVTALQELLDSGEIKGSLGH